MMYTGNGLCIAIANLRFFLANECIASSIGALTALKGVIGGERPGGVARGVAVPSPEGTHLTDTSMVAVTSQR